MHTSYPVWRARNLPFGRGILSLPQRGETALEMYSLDGDGLLVDTFEGHTDVVKEFVWRKNLDEFQLITWSKDGTLRFWPVDSDTKKASICVSIVECSVDVPAESGTFCQRQIESAT